MSTLKLRISLEPVEIEVEKNDYLEAWQERCVENGDIDPNDDAGEPSDAFVAEMVEEDYANGDRTYDEDFSSSSLTVEIPQ